MKIAKITSRKIVVYTLGGNNGTLKERTKMPEDNTVQEGELSLKAKTRLKNAIITLTEAYAHKKEKTKSTQENITFVTLTLCAQQKHDDKHIKRYMLDPFINYLKKEKDVTAYVWRAEAQKNGNIHFHILCNRWISWGDIRIKWNSLQLKEGYIADYKAKFSAMNLRNYINYEKAKDAQIMVKKVKEAKIKSKKFGKEVKTTFKARTIEKLTASYNYGVETFWEDPNSTDILKMHNITNTVAYMTKYMAKDSKKKPKMGSDVEQLEIFGEEETAEEAVRPIEGHLWGKSDTIDQTKILKVDLNKELEDFLKIAEKDKNNFFVEKDHFSLYYFGKSNHKSYPDSIRELYEAQQEANYLILNSVPVRSECGLLVDAETGEVI